MQSLYLLIGFTVVLTMTSPCFLACDKLQIYHLLACNVFRYIDALVNLVPLVLGLHDQLKAAAQDGDMETSHGICRIAVAVGETHSRYMQMYKHTLSTFTLALVYGFYLLIWMNLFVYDRVLLEQVEHWQEYLALVNMILFCTGIPGHYPVSETTSSLTLTFWYTLQVTT